MQAIATATSDANGKFSIDHELPPPPALLQADYKGVTYTQVSRPAARPPESSSRYSRSATKPPQGMQMAHLIMIEPSPTSLEISETFLIRNESNLTFQDPTNGTAQFYPPKGAGDTVQVSVTPPTQMTIQRQAVKAAKPGVLQDRLSGAARRDALRHALHAARIRNLLGKGCPGRSPDHGGHSGYPFTSPATESRKLGVEPEVQARLYRSARGLPSTSRSKAPDRSASARAKDAPEEDTGQPKTTEILATHLRQDVLGAGSHLRNPRAGRHTALPQGPRDVQRT